MTVTAAAATTAKNPIINIGNQIQAVITSAITNKRAEINIRIGAATTDDTIDPSSINGVATIAATTMIPTIKKNIGSSIGSNKSNNGSSNGIAKRSKRIKRTSIKYLSFQYFLAQASN